MTEDLQDGVTDSRFYMWRAIFALAHADEIVTEEEKRFMYEALAREPFSQEQKEILRNDIQIAQDTLAMYEKITDPEDGNRFFYFARMLLWADGDFARQEQQIMARLGRAHYERADLDSMVGHVGLELEDERRVWIEEDMEIVKKTGLKGMIDSVWGRFGR